VLETLWDAGHGGYLVGGGVRDALLGLPVSDWDVATDAHPERLLAIFPGATYQNRFGTVLARGLEITTFRRDHRYADHRRPDTVTFSQDIFEDLARRDLTINAIAWGRRGPDAAARLVDPADGQGDLEKRLVRAVGDPVRRFDEDALRLLRAVRIAARLDFTIEAVTRAAMVAHAADVRWVSEERIGSEIRRMLASERPSRAMRLLASTGILATTLPELEALSELALERTLAGLDLAAEVHPGEERLALATMLAEVGPAAAHAALLRLRLNTRDAEAVAALIAGANEPYDGAWPDADVRRYLAAVPPDLIPELLQLRSVRAAATDDEALVRRELELADRVRQEQASPLTLAALAIDGRDLRETLGLPEGPIIGVILAQLLEDVIAEPALNTRATLLTRASLLLDQRMQDGSSATGPRSAAHQVVSPGDRTDPAGRPLPAGGPGGAGSRGLPEGRGPGPRQRHRRGGPGALRPRRRR
jgi:tRNA nucleotidyltransferase (CCA-adding enzyme)